ncbi:MAG: hypothetical protein ACP5JE_05140 [Thermoplasmata archaeon]
MKLNESKLEDLLQLLLMLQPENDMTTVADIDKVSESVSFLRNIRKDLKAGRTIKRLGLGIDKIRPIVPFNI